MSVESALLVPVPEAEPVVQRWRDLFDPMAILGIPAHITVLYPFLPPERLTEANLDELQRLFAAAVPFSFVLDEVRRWPDVVYLAPTPEEPFRNLTALVVDRWPELQPYGGSHREVVPHLTVAHVADDLVAADIADDLAAKLPIASAAREVLLMVTDGAAWTAHTGFPLGVL